MSSNLIAANRLLDGASVWMSVSEEWVADMAPARTEKDGIDG